MYLDKVMLLVAVSEFVKDSKHFFSVNLPVPIFDSVFVDANKAKFVMGEPRNFEEKELTFEEALEIVKPFIQPRSSLVKKEEKPEGKIKIVKFPSVPEYEKGIWILVTGTVKAQRAAYDLVDTSTNPTIEWHFVIYASKIVLKPRGETYP